MLAIHGHCQWPYPTTVLRDSEGNEAKQAPCIFDYLAMVEGEGSLKYVVVLKDDMCGYVGLIVCTQATADYVYQELMDWFKRFSVMRQWVSDQGAYFCNEMVEHLQHAPPLYDGLYSVG